MQARFGLIKILWSSLCTGEADGIIKHAKRPHHPDNFRGAARRAGVCRDAGQRQADGHDAGDAEKEGAVLQK